MSNNEEGKISKKLTKHD